MPRRCGYCCCDARAFLTLLTIERCQASRRQGGTAFTMLSGLTGRFFQSGISSPVRVSTHFLIAVTGTTPKNTYQVSLTFSPSSAAVWANTSCVFRVTYCAAHSVHLCSNPVFVSGSTSSRYLCLSIAAPSRPCPVALSEVVNHTPTRPRIRMMSVGTSPTVKPYCPISGR